MTLPRSVSRALCAMRAQPTRALSVAELARISNVSTRTLHRHFEMFLGKSPLVVSGDIKFEHARRALLRAAPTASVSDIAYRSGFRHHGRFSVEYKRRFGEAPSETLRRQRDFLRSACPPANILVPPGPGPSVAILPFEANDRLQDVARGFADELATALARTGIVVADSPSQARYHLRGTIRAEGRDLRLASRLIDSRTSSRIWAHYLEAVDEPDFAFAEYSAEGIAAALQRALFAAETERARRQPEAEATAYDLTLRALPFAFALSQEGCARALDLLTRALAADPEYALAIALASWCHAQRAVYPFSGALTHDRMEASKLARRIVNTEGDATVLAVLANALALTGDLSTADLVTRRALAICGSSSWAWARSGLIQVCNGRPADGIERLTIALDLASNDPVKLNCFMGLGTGHLEAGRFLEAAHWFERAVREYPSSIWPHEFLGPAYVHSGRRDDARKSFAALQYAFPDLTISRVMEGLPFFTQRIRDHVANGLEAVGMRV